MSLPVLDRRGAGPPVPTPVDLPAAYERPEALPGVDLRLDGNEGLVPPARLWEEAARDAAALLRRYPDASALERDLAERLGVEPARVIVTAGADDALDRACRALLGPGRELVLPVPTFEMIERYAALRGGAVRRVPWPDGPYPVEAVVRAAGERTAAIAVVSPNNPTGATAGAEDVARLAGLVPSAVLLVDAAYGEFADDDLTAVALGLPDALVIRTFSKAWGLAGLRVGYAIGPAPLVARLRAAGQPYAVSGPSIAVARRWLVEGEEAVAAFVGRVRAERDALTRRLRELGADPIPSQANFVLARFADGEAVRLALAARGIAVRGWRGRPELENALRITLPGEPGAFLRLLVALDAALGKERAS